MPLKGKTAIITGSNSGIGLGIAKVLARHGATVVLNSFSDTAEDHALAREIGQEHGVEARYIQADMGNGEQCRALVETGGRLRHPDQQCRHPACGADRRVSARDVGRDHRDQPHVRLPHHRRGAAEDARGRMGPGHQHRLGPRADRLALQIRLYRRQARDRRADQDGGAGDGARADHRQRDLPRLRADPAGRGADPRDDEGIRHGPRRGDREGHAGASAAARNSPPSSRWAARRCSCVRTRRRRSQARRSAWMADGRRCERRRGAEAARRCNVSDRLPQGSTSSGSAWRGRGSPTAI